jgi:uncharacterized membrane protein YqaE (UPF0057 family)
MKYLLALLFPAFGFLAAGKWFQAIIALILQFTLIGWIPATIWAFLVINSHHADKRTARLERAIRESAPKSKSKKTA